jgi:hypothetical protein
MYWEYARFKLIRDPAYADAPTYGYLALPGDANWKELGVVVNTTLALNDLGKQGWELVGPPNDLNTVFTYKASNDTYHDRAHFVERDFWLKRPAGDT